MIRVMWLDRQGRVRTETGEEGLKEFLASAQLVWLDIASEPAAVSEPILRDHFKFHHLAIDDALRESHVPKVDDWGSYIYLVLHAVLFEEQGNEPICTLEFDAFLGANYLVTHHNQDLISVQHVWERCQEDDRHMKNGSARLLYTVADALVGEYAPVMETIEDLLEKSEDSVFESPSQSTLEEIFRIKRITLHLRRIMTPQQETLNKLARNDYAVVPEGDRVYFRDLYDHMIRLRDLAEAAREQAGNLMETHLSMVNKRMNEVVTILTIITTLFMPISFLVGFFGMNFFQPEEPMHGWTSEIAFWIVLGLVVFLSGGMFLWVRKRGWLTLKT
jgi:magnesium transporter